MSQNLNLPPSERSYSAEEDAEERIFQQFGLDQKKDNFNHPHGSLLFKGNRANPEGKKELTIGLRKGSRYPPETHTYRHVLTIQHGSGRISVNGVEQTYGPGDIFDIPGNVPHGFTFVEETTIVNQKF